MKKLFLITYIFCLKGISQNTQQKGHDFSIRGNVSIPGPITSKMYRLTFNGVYEANLSFNTRVVNNFYIGVGYQSVMFENDKSLYYQNYSAKIPYDTKLIGNGAYARFDYIWFYSKTGYMSYALQAGYMYSRYKNVNEDSSAANQPYVSTKFAAPFVQPEVSVNFIVDKTLSFSINLSYTTQFSHFDPKAPRFNQIKEISEASNNYVMSWINFGFGFNVLLNRKK